MNESESKRAYKAAWYLKNKERQSAKSAVRYLENRDHLLAKANAKYEAERETILAIRKAKYAKLTAEQKKKLIEKAKLFDKSNPNKANARTALRRKRVQRSTPNWLTKEQKRLIKAVYLKAMEISKLTGTEHHVDHVVPLTSEIVCGLHVHWNLQILPYSENLKKVNRVWPDMP